MSTYGTIISSPGSISFGLDFAAFVAVTPTARDLVGLVVATPTTARGSVGLVAVASTTARGLGNLVDLLPKSLVTVAFLDPH